MGGGGLGWWGGWACWVGGRGGGGWELGGGGDAETDKGELAAGMRDGGWARGFTAFSKRIVEALQEGRTIVDGAATFADGYRIQLVLDAARRAHESGCWAKID